MLRNFRGGRRAIDDDIYPFSFLVASLNAPVYVALPVRDAELVDRTLERLDVYLAEIARSRDERGWLDLEMDFYRSPLSGDGPPVRCYSVGFGPVKWRVFFARVGGGLYLASKRFILEDLERLEPSRGEGRASGRQAGEGPVAHAMIRIRPEHWKEILPAFRLGWAEASREACLNNLGPLSSAARLALSAEGGVKAEEILRRADAAHAVHFFCPDGGRISWRGGRIVCTAHVRRVPRQASARRRTTRWQAARLVRRPDDGSTFLEDGLHAVVTLERSRSSVSRRPAGFIDLSRGLRNGGRPAGVANDRQGFGAIVVRAAANVHARDAGLRLGARIVRTRADAGAGNARGGLGAIVIRAAAGKDHAPHATQLGMDGPGAAVGARRRLAGNQQGERPYGGDGKRGGGTGIGGLPSSLTGSLLETAGSGCFLENRHFARIRYPANKPPRTACARGTTSTTGTAAGQGGPVGGGPRSAAGAEGHRRCPGPFTPARGRPRRRPPRGPRSSSAGDRRSTG